MKTVKYFIALLALAGSLSACIVREQPRRAAWVNGHYEYGRHGARYWVPGHYVRTGGYYRR